MGVSPCFVHQNFHLYDDGKGLTLLLFSENKNVVHFVLAAMLLPARMQILVGYRNDGDDASAMRSVSSGWKC